MLTNNSDTLLSNGQFILNQKVDGHSYKAHHNKVSNFGINKINTLAIYI